MPNLLRTGDRPRPTLSLGVLLFTALVLGVVAVLLSPAVRGQAATVPPDPFTLLECDERSLTDTGEVAYVVASAPLFPSEFRASATPEEVAIDFARSNSLANASAAPQEVFRSVERVDYLVKSSDGRVVGVVTALNRNGWRDGGSVYCADGYRPPVD